MPELKEKKILVSVEEAMEALSIGRSKLLQLTYEGKLPTVKVGRRRLYPLDGLAQWARDLMVETLHDLAEVALSPVEAEPARPRARQPRRLGPYVQHCVICGVVITGFGNNAYPLAEGRCCDNCDGDVVMARARGEQHGSQ